MKHFNFWQKWLLVMGILVILMGLSFPFLGFLNIEVTYVNSVFWEDGIVPAEAKTFQAWIYGTYGAMATAFGLFIYFVASNSFKARKKWAWNCLATCISVWFVVDTFFSVYFQAYTNAFNNVILYVLLILPLVFTKKDFALPPGEEQ
jgi:hypothetical protein